MSDLRVTTYQGYQADADIMARMNDDGGVTLWFWHKDINQDRHKFTCTPQQWDRLVAWVEWKRRDRVGGEGED